MSIFNRRVPEQPDSEPSDQSVGFSPFSGLKELAELGKDIAQDVRKLLDKALSDEGLGIKIKIGK